MAKVQVKISVPIWKGKSISTEWVNIEMMSFHFDVRIDSFVSHKKYLLIQEAYKEAKWDRNTCLNIIRPYVIKHFRKIVRRYETWVNNGEQEGFTNSLRKDTKSWAGSYARSMSSNRRMFP